MRGTDNLTRNRPLHRSELLVTDGLDGRAHREHHR
jgi:hypothetical protein